MRVTQSMLNSQMLRNYNNNLDRYEKLQNQMSTGKKINKPSDDPVGIGFSLRYRNNLALNEQHQKNVDLAISQVEYTEQLVKGTNDIMQRAKELATQGATGTYSDIDMDSIAAEVEELYNQLVDLGNTVFNGKYIFNGQQTDIKPYDKSNAMSVTPHKGKTELEIGIGVTIPTNVSGADIFGEATDSSNAFKLLDDLKNALYAHDKSALNNINMGIDQRVNTLLTEWAEIGARANRLDLVDNRLKDESVNLQTLLSKTEDADMAELIVNLKSEENVFQASLSAGARIIQPSLVNFLK